MDKNEIRSIISESLEARNRVRDQFNEFVTNRNIPISERLHIWETYSEEILPKGSWWSEAPECLRTMLEDRERYSFCSFDDLAEYLISDYIWESETLLRKMTTYEAIEAITNKYPEIKEKFEEVFACGISGTVKDW